MEDKIYLKSPPGDTIQSFMSSVDPDEAKWYEMEQKYGWKYKSKTCDCGCHCSEDHNCGEKGCSKYCSNYEHCTNRA